MIAAVAVADATTVVVADVTTAVAVGADVTETVEIVGTEVIATVTVVVIAAHLRTTRRTNSAQAKDHKRTNQSALTGKKTGYAR